MIQSNYYWINIVCLAMGTLAIRFSFIAVSSKIQVSERWRQIFSFIPAAILPAFVAPAVFFHQGHSEWALGKERGLVLILATAVCYFSRSTLATISFGLAALYFLS